MEEDDSPEGQAFLYRDAVMTVLAGKTLTIGGMAREDIPLDEAEFSKAVNDLAALAGMVVEGLMPEGIPAGSRSLPEVWENWDDFVDKAADLENAAAALAEGDNPEPIDRQIGRWRLFFLVCEGTWGHARGGEFMVSHYLMRPRAPGTGG